MNPAGILIFDSGRGFGGSSKSLFILAKNLDKTRFRPIVVVFHKGPFTEQAKLFGIKVIQIKFFDATKNPIYKLSSAIFGKENIVTSNLRYYLDFIFNGIISAKRIVNLARKEKIDLFHLNNGLLENLPALISAKILRKPAVVHVRGTEELRFLEKIIWKWVKLYYMYNKTSIKLWSKVIPRNRIISTTNYVDFDLVDSVSPIEARRLLAIPFRAGVVGFVGRLVGGKGADIFLEAASIVLRKIPNSIFLIVGSGDLELDLKKRASELGISEKVKFMGWRNDIYKIMSSFDVLVQATTTFPESFGNTVIEVMSLSKPVIASNVQGPNEIVVDGETGFLVRPGDAEDLANKIILLLKNKKLAKKLGKAGLERIKSKYDVKQGIKSLEKTYRGLVNN